uniref:Uncharacterized protein n=1 Tax=Arundo donax TaxID=35708 RepID=A0A0A9DAB8_ARUDO
MNSTKRDSHRDYKCNLLRGVGDKLNPKCFTPGHYYAQPYRNHYS